MYKLRPIFFRSFLHLFAFSLYFDIYPRNSFLIWMNMHNAHEFNYEMCRCSVAFFVSVHSILLLLLLQRFELMLYWSFALAFAIKTEFLYRLPYAKCTFDWGAKEIFNWIELRKWNRKEKRTSNENKIRRRK